MQPFRTSTFQNSPSFLRFECINRKRIFATNSEGDFIFRSEFSFFHEKTLRHAWRVEKILVEGE